MKEFLILKEQKSGGIVLNLFCSIFLLLRIESSFLLATVATPFTPLPTLSRGSPATDLGVDQPDALQSVGLRGALVLHGHDAEAGDAEGGLAGALEEQHVVREAGVGDAEGGQDAGQGHAGSALRNNAPTCQNAVTVAVKT